MKNFTSREVAIAAALAAFSSIVQLIHIGYLSPQWGMWIDIVAVSWIIAFFLYGVKLSLIVSLMGALIITLFAPETWLGASMKWAATVPMWLSLYIFLLLGKKKPEVFKKFKFLTIPLLAGLILRIMIVLPFNYFYALPIWTKMTPAQAWTAIPWYVIAGFNVIQGILDVILAWIVVFKFKIDRYGKIDE